MSATLVVDCSVAMARLFQDEATTHCIELLERMGTESAVVPGR